MPNRDPKVAAGGPRATGKDQGKITVRYRSQYGKVYNATVIGPATRLAAPGSLAVAPQGTAGTTTYRYRVAAVDTENGEGNAAVGATTATGAATLNGTNFNRISWNAVSGASGYRIYGRTGTDTTVTLLATVGTVTTWDDTGAATPQAGKTVPSFGTDRLRLMVHRGPGRIIRNNVPMATASKQTHVYYNR